MATRQKTLQDRLYKVAVALNKVWQAQADREFSNILFRPYLLANIQEAYKTLGSVREKGWAISSQEAAGRLILATEQVIRHLKDQVSNIRSISWKAPNITDIYQDLISLADEFEDVNCDLTRHMLYVVTAPIVLKEMNFGRFKIQLTWGYDGNFSYRVKALEPNKARGSDNVTHPHVSGEMLCEGEGGPSIRAALGQCRILDFFIIVRQTLKTYSQGAAFVEIADWEGQGCRGCGCTLHDDDGGGECHSCNSALCDDCCFNCQGCDNYYCGDCLLNCELCHDGRCKGCVISCPYCDKICCEGCCPSDSSCCRVCQEEADNNQEEEEETTDDDTVQSHSSGIPANSGVPDASFGRATVGPAVSLAFPDADASCDDERDAVVAAAGEHRRAEYED